MISASHNPASDNGIKFFGPDGFKLSDEAEAEIERLVFEGVEPVQPQNIGRAKRIDDGRFRYIERIKASLPSSLPLKGLRVAVDCANGAAHRAAPEALWEMGADIVPIGVSPNGTNINDDCGSTCTDAISAAVVEHRADVGITLDGDADRVMIVDENGTVADGDQIMALLADRWAGAGKLNHNTLVATVMSNLGLERFLDARGMKLERTKVGDRYVVERMRQGGFNLGGEQSGHIVMTDHATTGDGLLAGLQFLAAMVETGRAASELIHNFETVPQLLKNVRYEAGHDPLGMASVQKVINDAEIKLNGYGRLLIRKSGTEPLIRVMAECEDPVLLEHVVDGIVEEVAANA